MNENFTVAKTQVPKVSITISREQLWKNYGRFWVETVYDGTSKVADINPMILVLLGKSPLNQSTLRDLFRQNYTCALMGDAAMREFEGEVIREIVVLDPGCSPDRVVIPHSCINF